MKNRSKKINRFLPYSRQNIDKSDIDEVSRVLGEDFIGSPSSFCCWIVGYCGHEVATVLGFGNVRGSNDNSTFATNNHSDFVFTPALMGYQYYLNQRNVLQEREKMVPKQGRTGPVDLVLFFIIPEISPKTN